MNALQAAQDTAIDWNRDQDNANGWVGEYAPREQARTVESSLSAAGYETSASDDRAANEDNIARRWWVWVIVPEAA